MIDFAKPGNIHLKLKENPRMLLIGEDYDLTGKASGVLDYLRKNKPGLKLNRPKPGQK